MLLIVWPEETDGFAACFVACFAAAAATVANATLGVWAIGLMSPVREAGCLLTTPRDEYSFRNTGTAIEAGTGRYAESALFWKRFSIRE